MPPMKSAITLGISEFAVPAPRMGSIEVHSGYGPLPNVGPEIHQLVQAQRLLKYPHYLAEKWVSYSFTRNGQSITVNGRMDGYCPGVPPVIEEIKTAYNPDELHRTIVKNVDHPYLLQLRTYAYIHFRHTGQIAECVLHLVSSRTRQGFDVPVDLDVSGYEAWLERRLEEIIAQAQMFGFLKKRRKALAKTFTFPFAEPRPGQIELMQSVAKNLNTKTNLLFQAPTGLGKTAGVLFPTLQDALARGEKVIYVTPKNSQHEVAEDALHRLQKAGTKARGLTLHAKAKMCLKEQVLCQPDYCEYAKDYYKKVADHSLVEKLARKKNLSARTFAKIGQQYEVCPFELQLDTLHRADVVVCDYNYVFSPRNAVGSLTYNGFSNKTSPNLVIDEAHNLPARANDYFSASLSAGDLAPLAQRLSTFPVDLSLAADQLIAGSRDLIARAGSASPHRAAEVQLNAQAFTEHAARVQEFLGRYLESPAQLQPRDAVLEFCNLWANFTQALQNLEIVAEDFFCTYTPTPEGGMVKITCCDASQSLLASYKNFANVVAFSATVKPFDYYAKLLGFAERPLLTAEFPSPFPGERRKVLLVPQVSTKFRDREANYGKIQEGIERIVAVQAGNYFVFFPSFAFLERIGSQLNLPQFQVLAQRRDMKRQEIQEYLEILRQGARPTVILAVQGGVFAEGVDYPGEMLIGAIIVGPALPTYDLERELLRAHYAKKYGADQAFDYAYTFPAMAKVVQSAGRVIRSADDRGLIVLMDRRFLEPNYVKSMPADWVGDEPQLHVSQHLLNDIRMFWENNGPA